MENKENENENEKEEFDEGVKEGITRMLKNWQQQEEEEEEGPDRDRDREIERWVVELNEYLSSMRLLLPSPDLAQLLVSHLLSSSSSSSSSFSSSPNSNNNNNNNECRRMWKLIHHVLSSSLSLVFPFPLLSLLSSSLFPLRHSLPLPFSLFLSLLHLHALSFPPPPPLPSSSSSSSSSSSKILKSVVNALHLPQSQSQSHQHVVVDLGHAFMLFYFNLIIALIDTTLSDLGLLSSHTTFSQTSSLLLPTTTTTTTTPITTAIGIIDQHLTNTNSITALHVLETLTATTKSTILLRSLLFNMPEKFNCLLQRVQFLESLELASSEFKLVNQVLPKVSANIRQVSRFDCCLSKHKLIGMLVNNVGSCKTSFTCNYRTCQSSCWVPFDIYMENAMDSKQIPTKSAIDVLTEAIKTLQIFNQASWQETFLALWLSALRLVQREREPPEGPVPHLEARLCVLLSVVPLAIANVLMDESEHNQPSVQVNNDSKGSRKLGLISSIQVLTQFSCLLCPPALVVDAANQAARKAASFVYNSMNEEGQSATGIHANTNTDAGGNMGHLIVEACIARNLMDASAYFWPGYVTTSAIPMSDSLPLEESPWFTFMKGTPLSNSLINSLTAIPASSLEEIEKLYNIALNGSEAERPAAAKILCGASLIRGWYIQEHVVHYVVKLLAYPVPHSGSQSLLVDNMSMLNAVLLGVSSVDTVHILSLHGVVPKVAASLLPLCEAFGSVKPTSNRTGNDPSTSSYMAFSLAFLFLYRLWKFCRPPLDHCITEGGGAGGLDFLLSLHNNGSISSRLELKGNLSLSESASVEPVYIDSFRKLKAWCCQHKSCVASPLSGLSPGSSIHQVANTILSMIYHNMNKGGISTSNSSSATPTSSNSSSSLINAGEDAFQRPMLPAWEVLQALPFVLEAILTACVHGRLSSRDLTTGLRDLVDFLPASIAAIIDYFSSEVTRGVWKLVPMNGTDWPSPAAVLQSVESEIKAILTYVGVEVPNCCSGNSPAMLPLPMAALVSLSITFKLDKSLEYIHAITGAALENCASGCPGPSMPIIGSLWAQKVRRWHYFIVVSCSRSVFRHNKESVAQLLRSCFTSFLGSFSVSKSKLTAECSVNGLLGSTITTPGAYPFVAPGFLFLRSCRNIHNIEYLNEIIMRLVAEYSNELAGRRASAGSHRQLKSGQASLTIAAQSAKEVATLGATLLCAAGGIQLVQELYKETIPTFLLTSRVVKQKNESVLSHILEGYGMAYLLILSGSIIWGVEAKLPSWTFSRRNRTVGVHLDFLAQVMEGKISLSCNPITWKTYVSCLVGLLVSLAPAWIQEVKVDTLRKLAGGLSRWHEYELAFSLLQRGGVTAMGALVELVNVIEFEHN